MSNGIQTMQEETMAVKRGRTMAEIPRGSVVHKSYGERDHLRCLAVCNNINGPIAPSGLMTLDDKKVTCKRCLRIIAGKPIPKPVKPLRTETERRAQLAALEARAALKADTLKLVEQNALYWIAEGKGADEPAGAKEAFELLIEHGYTFVATAPAVLRRPDGSVVARPGEPTYTAGTPKIEVLRANPDAVAAFSGAALSIEIVESATGKVEKKLGPFASAHLRDKADNGLQHRIDHERFYTRFVR